MRSLIIALLICLAALLSACEINVTETPAGYPAPRNAAPSTTPARAYPPPKATGTPSSAAPSTRAVVLKARANGVLAMDEASHPLLNGSGHSQT